MESFGEEEYLENWRYERSKERVRRASVRLNTERLIVKLESGRKGKEDYEDWRDLERKSNWKIGDMREGKEE